MVGREVNMEFRTHETTGGVCCSSINDQGEHVAPRHPCAKCVAFFARRNRRHLHRQEKTMNEFEPPRPYDEALKRLRPELPRMNARIERERREEDFTPPDPYAETLERLRREVR
jgi:hypothetical protein